MDAPDFSAPPAIPSAMTEPAAPRATEARPEARRVVQDSIVDLVDRFARALDRHREAASADGVDNSAPMIDLTFALGGRPQADVPVAFAEPEATHPIPVVPAALQPLGFEEEDDEIDDGPLPDFGLSLGNRPQERPFAAPAASLAVEDAVDEEQVEENYPSLLAMKSPFGLAREPVRIETDEDEADGITVEPVVVFPGQEARRMAPLHEVEKPSFGTASLRPFDSPTAQFGSTPPATTPPAPAVNASDTERALREALEKLQRLSGAA